MQGLVFDPETRNYAPTQEILDRELVIKTIKENFGMTLTPARRKVEVLLVEDTEPPE